jgi:hypothetical protein
MSCEELLRELGMAIEGTGVPSKQAEAELPAVIFDRVENQGFEDGYLGAEFDTLFKGRSATSELAMVYEIGYLKGSEQFEIDAEMADRGEWPPVGGLRGDET